MDLAEKLGAYVAATSGRHRLAGDLVAMSDDARERVALYTA
jgi:hypothetical protein